MAGSPSMSWSAEHMGSKRALWAIAALIALAAGAFSVRGTSSPQDVPTAGPHYFETAEIASGGRFPIIPKGELSEADARKRKVYGIATFDDAGKLLTYEAVKDGRRYWHSKLAYTTAGVLESETYTGPKGAVVLWRYDPNGWFVDSKMIKGPDEEHERESR